MHVKLVSLFADRLNLNGDQANLLVLEKRLTWAGHSVDIINVRSHDELRSARGDFIFLGHGSLAAWAACHHEWPNMIQDFHSECKRATGMSVSSASDLLLPKVSGVRPGYGENRSEFVVEVLDGKRVLGYKNTEQIQHNSMQVENLLLTWLHGPVLAKNPELADDIIRRIVNKQELGSLANENTRKIDEIVAGVWQLEAE